MSRIVETLNLRAGSVIRNLESNFSTRRFIWELMNAYEEDYIELLLEVLPANNEDRRPRIIHELHKQIGKYLLNHATELSIEKDDDPKKEQSISPFGKTSTTQNWHKL